MKNLLLFIASCFLLFGCKQQVELDSAIDPKLRVYYDTFLKEAKIRNKKIPDIGPFTLQFGIEEGNFDGRTYYSENRINIDSVKWKVFGPTYKESLLFHEFGHLFFRKNHDIQPLPNGEFRSLMKTYENIPNPEQTLIFTGIRRKYYLDEFFDILTPVPEWSLPSYDPFPITQSNRKLLASQEFETSKELTAFMSKLSVSWKNIDQGLMNVKILKDTPSGMSMNNIFTMANTPTDQKSAFIESKNYEIELRYKVNAGYLAMEYNDNTAFKNYSYFTQYIDRKAYDMSGDRYYSSLLHINANLDFNTFRLVRKGDFWATYLNEKLIFYGDTWSNTAITNLYFGIYSGEANSDFDLDYFRIYTR